MFFRMQVSFKTKNVLLKALSRKYSIVNMLREPQIGKNTEIKGWITNVRKQKDFIFLDVNDGSTSERLQVVIPRALNVDIKKISTGSSLRTVGQLSLSPNGEVELVADSVKIVKTCNLDEGYPFAPRKQYQPEYIRKYFHLRQKTGKLSSMLRVRSAASFAFHSVFKEEGFLHVHTPILTSNDCEGAGESFKVIPDNPELLESMTKPLATNVDDIFFDTKTYLTVSGQLHLEALANGLGNVYTFGPTFRAENSKSRFHLAEFYMIEGEMVFITSLHPLLDFVERLIKKVTKNILSTNIEDVIKCQESSKDQLKWLEKKFKILPHEEALGILREHSGEFKEGFIGGLKKEHELFLVKYLGDVPVFVVNFPKDNKPFYMKECPEDDCKVMAFDLLAPGIGEIVGGSLREDDIDKLKSRIPKGSSSLDWYLDVRKFGGVSTGGFGLGFERYLQAILKIDNIKDTVAFPRWPHNCSM